MLILVFGRDRASSSGAKTRPSVAGEPAFLNLRDCLRFFFAFSLRRNDSFGSVRGVLGVKKIALMQGAQQEARVLGA